MLHCTKHLLSFFFIENKKNLTICSGMVATDQYNIMKKIISPTLLMKKLREHLIVPKKSIFFLFFYFSSIKEHNIWKKIHETINYVIIGYMNNTTA